MQPTDKRELTGVQSELKKHGDMLAELEDQLKELAIISRKFAEQFQKQQA